MKNFNKRLLVMVFVFGVAFAAKAIGAKNVYAAEINNEKIISTSGRGIVMVKPDTANISIGITTIETENTTAQKKNSEIYDNVLKALYNIGITQDNIKTNYYYVSPEYDYNNVTRDKILKGYRVSNFISVITKDIDNTGKYIAAAMDAGATEIRGVEFYLDDPNIYYSDALKLAIKNAKSTANVILGEIGTGNITIKNVLEQKNNNSYSVSSNVLNQKEMAVMDSAAGATPAPSIGYDDIEIEAVVNIDFLVVD